MDDIKPVFQTTKNESGVKTVIEVSLKVPSDFDALLNDDGEAPRTAIDPKEDVTVIQYTVGARLGVRKTRCSPTTIWWRTFEKTK